MILVLLTDSEQRNFDFDADFLKLVWMSNTTSLQDRRCSERSSTEDHLPSGSYRFASVTIWFIVPALLCSLGRTYLNTFDTITVASRSEQNLHHHAVCQDAKITGRATVAI